MVIAEITLDHSALVLRPTIHALSDLTMDREFQPVRDEDTIWLFFSVETNEFDAFDEQLSEDHTVSAPRVIADFGDRRIYRIQIAETAKVVTPILARMGIKILAIQSHGEGWFLRLQSPDRAALISFRKYCNQKGISFSLKSLYLKEEVATKGRFGLTDAQQEALLASFENGYYNDPRDFTLQELAEEMGISSAALGRRLRRATAKLITGTLLSEE